MEAAFRSLVRRRAQGHCEYCRLPEVAIDIPFHIEHVRARQHGGTDDHFNLCLACDRCNFYKGPNLTSIDPMTGKIVPLFHPRDQSWHDHFSFHNGEIVGCTAAGRATIVLLQMNAPRRVQLRTALIASGQFQS